MIVTLRNVDTPFLSVIESLLQLRKEIFPSSIYSLISIY